MSIIRGFSRSIIGDIARHRLEEPVTERIARRLTRRCSEPARHKVLGRGRPSAEGTRALARPRAEALRPVAELGS
jgi:hypothetical protein